MAIAYGSDQFKGIKFWDGVHRPVGISHPDELKAIQDAYKQATGRELPLMTFNGAWVIRFEALAGRSADEAKNEIVKAVKAEIAK